MRLSEVVSVLEIANTAEMSVNQMVSFTDDEEGNREANELFKKLVAANDPELSAETLEDMVNDGYYNTALSNYYVAIVHSTPIMEIPPTKPVLNLILGHLTRI